MNQNSDENQQVNVDKIERNKFILALNESAVESRLQKVLGVNPKIWNDLKDQGILPRTGTYGEFLTKIFNHYRQQNAVALAKVKAKADEMAAKRTYRSSDTESGLPRVVEAEKISKIRLDSARERQIHLQNLQTRNELISKSELYTLIAPMVGNMVNILRSAADDDPKVQPTIDKCFASLHEVGLQLLAQVNRDSDSYVEEMMNNPVDLDDIINNAQLEIE